MHEQSSPGFAFTSAVEAWLASAGITPFLVGTRVVIRSGATSWELRPEPGAWWAVHRSDEHGERFVLRGTATTLQRFFVWALAADAQWALQRRRAEAPQAPPDVAAWGGPLRLVPQASGRITVTEGGRIVAEFPSEGRQEATQLTHYGYWDPAWLIEQAMGPRALMVFATADAVLTEDEQAELSSRIRAWAVAKEHHEDRKRGDQAAALRSHGVEELRDWLRRLRFFSFVVPPPKDVRGDALSVAFRIDSGPAASLLLNALGLDAGPSSRVQRLSVDEVQDLPLLVRVQDSWLDVDGDPLSRSLVELRLWNPADPYEVTQDLVDRAVRLEAVFTRLGFGSLARETALLGRITPERQPDLFDSGDR